MDKDQLRDKLQKLKEEMTNEQVRYARKWFQEEEFRILGGEKMDKKTEDVLKFSVREIANALLEKEEYGELSPETREVLEELAK